MVQRVTNVEPRAANNELKPLKIEPGVAIMVQRITNVEPRAANNELKPPKIEPGAATTEQQITKWSQGMPK